MGGQGPRQMGTCVEGVSAKPGEESRVKEGRRTEAGWERGVRGRGVTEEVSVMVEVEKVAAVVAIVCRKVKRVATWHHVGNIVFRSIGHGAERGQAFNKSNLVPSVSQCSLLLRNVHQHSSLDTYYLCTLSFSILCAVPSAP